MTGTSNGAIASATGPLAGVRVLDLVSVIMGPYATQLLGDLGADVVSIEVPGGDPCRAIGAAGDDPQISGAAFNILRNKRNITLDLKSEGGHRAFERLVAGFDVFITNVRPRALDSLRINYEDVKSANPSIIYCEAHGFATDSTRADEAAYDDVIQGSSGLVDVLSVITDRPVLAPFLLQDKLSGVTIVYAVIAAMYHRERTGEGQRVEVPMHDTNVAFNLVEHGADAITVPPKGPPGYGRITTQYRRPHKTEDGYIIVIPYSGQNWVDLLTAAGHDDAANDPRLASAAGRTRHYAELYRELGDAIATNTTTFWVEFCNAHSIASSPIASLSDLVGELPVAEHPTGGRFRQIPPPVRFSATPQNIRRPAPRIGQHTTEVLTEAGLSAEEIDELGAAGALEFKTRS